VKAFVDSRRCQGHTLCAMIAPHAFQLNDIDGSASPTGDAVPPAKRKWSVKQRDRAQSRQSGLMTKREDIGVFDHKTPPGGTSSDC
ncbi:ferredoxin, partial [Mycobacterium rhizamassiliense]